MLNGNGWSVENMYDYVHYRTQKRTKRSFRGHSKSQEPIRMRYNVPTNQALEAARFWGMKQAALFHREGDLKDPVSPLATGLAITRSMPIAALSSKEAHGLIWELWSEVRAFMKLNPGISIQISIVSLNL